MKLLVPCLAVLLAACADARARGIPPVERVQVVTLAGSERAFAADLFGALPKEGDLAFSPASVHAALLLAYAGARAETRDAMRAALHLPDDWTSDRTQAAAGVMAAEMERATDDLTLRTADALWGQKGYPFEEATLDVLDRFRGAELRRVDFAKADANRRINEWVEEQTNGRIRDLVPAGVLVPETRLVLVNALYLRARWLKPFFEKSTKPAPFHLSESEAADVPTMHARVHGRYTEDEHARIAEVPYLGGVAMVLVLPKESLAEVQKSLDPKRLDTWLGKSMNVELDLALPKFEVESELSLADTLGALGLAELFDPKAADLSGFNGGREPLWLSAALHKAWVAVDEEGTEAAAATSLVAVGASISPDEPVAFHVDRPFLFLIVDRKTDQVLFFGRISDPR